MGWFSTSIENVSPKAITNPWQQVINPDKPFGVLGFLKGLIKVLLLMDTKLRDSF